MVIFNLYGSFSILSNQMIDFSKKYVYNEDGIRTSKTSNGVTTKFLLDSYNVIEQTDGTTTLHFFYDANGAEITSSTSLAKQNPFRYRGYYYDAESGLYYLQSRYYDPVTGRFVNGDKFVSTGQGVLGYNMYLYCNNNPVMYSDNSGDFPWLALFTIAATTILGGIIGYNSDIKISKKEKNDNEQTLINKVPEITKNVINQTNQGTQFEKIDAKKTYNKNNIPKKEDVELTKKDRVENALIGASIGLFAGGTLATVAGVVGSVVVGSAWVNIGIFGGTGAQTAATGALAYNFFAIIIAPALGIELEPIEFES